jgi:hypothetical protein
LAPMCSMREIKRIEKIFILIFVDNGYEQSLIEH